MDQMDGMEKEAKARREKAATLYRLKCETAVANLRKLPDDELIAGEIPQGEFHDASRDALTAVRKERGIE